MGEMVSQNKGHMSLDWLGRSQSLESNPIC